MEGGGSLTCNRWISTCHAGRSWQTSLGERWQERTPG